MSMTIEQQQQQLRRKLEYSGIADTRVLDAIEHTPRHLFVPQHSVEMAYEDTALSIGLGQTISQPYIVALMTEALALTGHETILEIGTGSGYQTAVLAQLAGTVFTIERLAELSTAAQGRLGSLGIENVEFHNGDGSLGLPACAPFDSIIVTAAAPDIPPPLVEQLTDSGRLVIPVGDEFSQTLELIHLQDGMMTGKKLCSCRFVKLVGDAAWKNEE